MAQQIPNNKYVSDLRNDIVAWKNRNNELGDALARTRLWLALAVIVATGAIGACGYLVAHYAVKIV